MTATCWLCDFSRQFTKGRKFFATVPEVQRTHILSQVHDGVRSSSREQLSFTQYHDCPNTPCFLMFCSSGFLVC